MTDLQGFLVQLEALMRQARALTLYRTTAALHQVLRDARNEVFEAEDPRPPGAVRVEFEVTPPYPKPGG